MFSIDHHNTPAPASRHIASLALAQLLDHAYGQSAVREITGGRMSEAHIPALIELLEMEGEVLLGTPSASK